MSQSIRVHPHNFSSPERESPNKIVFHMNMMNSSSKNLLHESPLRNYEEMNSNRVSKYIIPVDEDEELQISNGQRLRNRLIFIKDPE